MIKILIANYHPIYKILLNVWKINLFTFIRIKMLSFYFIILPHFVFICLLMKEKFSIDKLKICLILIWELFHLVFLITSFCSFFNFIFLFFEKINSDRSGSDLGDPIQNRTTQVLKNLYIRNWNGS